MPNPPVSDWSTDYDVFDAGYVEQPFPIWDELRTTCPIAHTERWGGSWLPTRYEDVAAIAHDVEHFSSRNVSVVPPPEDDLTPGGFAVPVPPIDCDPPVHTWTRRLMLPWFSHKRVAEYEPITRDLCNSLIDGFIDRGRADAAAEYAQQIPARVIALTLGVPGDMADTFTGWVRDVLEFAHDEERRNAGRDAIAVYLMEKMEERRGEPGDDLISALLHTEVEGAPIPDIHVLGMAALTLIAGVDTTWSGIGSALWHLATHDDDRRRLVAEPSLMLTAIEELLRAYSPVTMARIVADDVEVDGCPMKAGDRVLMSFPAANRDPAAFDRPDEVLLDREVNRHLAFGVGIHRCAGSNLARMELRVALEAWLARIPEFHLEDGLEVTWAGGQVRGPRKLPVVFT
jgi:cytochrome P450